MVIKFGESGHPVFRTTSPRSRGTLKSRGGGKLSIHLCADGGTIETVFRTIISVNQLRIFGAVSDLCEEYKACHVRTVRPVLAGQSDPLFVPTSLLMKTPTPSTDGPAQEDLPQTYQERVERLSQQIVWLRFVLMQDSWQQLESDSTSWQRTLKNSHNLQNQWHVVNTLGQEMKNHLTRKVGFEKTPKLGPCWKSQPVTYKVNMDWKLELILWTMTILTCGSEFHITWVSWSRTWATRATTIRKRLRYSSKIFRWNRMYLLLRADQRSNETTKTYFCQLIHKNYTYWVKEGGLMLSQKLIRPSLTQCQNNWVLFFILVIYLEKKMERLNSGD